MSTDTEILEIILTSSKIKYSQAWSQAWLYPRISRGDNNNQEKNPLQDDKKIVGNKYKMTYR